MSRRQFLILLGIWIMLFLFLGFPAAGDKLIALGTGIALIIAAWRSPASARQRAREDVPYVEHSAPRRPAMTDITSPARSDSNAGPASQ